MANPAKSRAVVLLSGGMDSAVCAALAVRDHIAAAVHVSYGQRTEERERQSFLAICRRLNILDQLMVRNEALPAIGGSALTDEGIAVPDCGASEHGAPEHGAPEHGTPEHGTAEQTAAKHEPAHGPSAQNIPVTYVPFRNAHFLAVAVSWAEVLDAEKVYIGAVEQDSSGYPDCRPAYYQAFNQVVRAGTKDGRIEILTPLIAMRKSQIVQLGLELGAPFDLTWSCYRREDQACGTCDSCVLRMRAFQTAGVKDPIPYAESVK